MVKITCNYCNNEFNYNIVILLIYYLFNNNINICCKECGTVSCYWLNFRVVHDVVHENRIERKKKWINP